MRGFFRCVIRFPLWLWTAIWGLELLGSPDWGDAIVNAFVLAYGFLYVIGPRPEPGAVATVGADGTSEPQEGQLTVPCRVCGDPACRCWWHIETERRGARNDGPGEAP